MLLASKSAMNGNDQHPITFLRTSWKFAAISQWMHMFHEAIGLEEFDTEKLENELSGFGTEQDYIVDLNKRLLKAISAFRSIKDDTWETLVRKEFNKRAPEEPNPFGEEPVFKVEEPLPDVEYQDTKMQDDEMDVDHVEQQPDTIHWNDLSLEQKVHIIHSLCEWSLVDASRFKDLNKKSDEEEQNSWRVDPVGYDAKGNTYWVFDDNRLYQQASDAPINKKTKKPPVKTKKRKRPPERRSSRRQQVIDNSDSSLSEEDEDEEDDQEEQTDEHQADVSWQTVCVTLQEWETFPQRFKGSKNPDEKYLYKVLEQNLLPPILEELRKVEKEKLMAEALMHRKRSSRLVGKELHEEAEKQRQKEEEAKREGERRALRDAALKTHDDKSREERLRIREDRASDRELRLAMREQQAQEKKLYAERKAEEKRKRKEAKERGDLKAGSDTEEEAQSDDNWTFDCICGAHGDNYDDGREMVNCDNCNVWQHTDCVKQEAKAAGKPIKDWDNFVCPRCQRKRTKVKDEDGEVDVMAVSDEDTTAALKLSSTALNSAVPKLKIKPPTAPTLAKDTTGLQKPKKPRKPRKPSAAKLAKDAAAAQGSLGPLSGPLMATWSSQRNMLPQGPPQHPQMQMQAPRPMAYQNQSPPSPALASWQRDNMPPPPPSVPIPPSLSRPPAPPMMSSTFGPPLRPAVSTGSPQSYPSQHQSYSSQHQQMHPRDQQQQYPPITSSNGISSMRPPHTNSYGPPIHSTLPAPMSSTPAYQQYSPRAPPSFPYTAPRPMHQSPAPMQQYPRPPPDFMQGQRPVYSHTPSQGQPSPYQMYSQPAYTSSPSHPAHSFAPTPSSNPPSAPVNAFAPQQNPNATHAGPILPMPLPPHPTQSQNPNHGHAKKSSMDLKFMME